MKGFFIKLGFWLVISTRLYYNWSRLYRSMFERGYRNYRLAKLNSLGELEENLGKLKWVADGVLELGDAISYPGKAQRLIDESRHAKSAFDCDDFSIYAVHQIKDMNERGIIDASRIGLVQVVWLDNKGRFRGHNICTFYLNNEEGWCHVSNWYRGRVRRDLDSFRDVLDDIVGEGTLLGIASCDHNLDLVSYRIYW